MVIFYFSYPLKGSISPGQGCQIGFVSFVNSMSSKSAVLRRIWGRVYRMWGGGWWHPWYLFCPHMVNTTSFSRSNHLFVKFCGFYLWSIYCLCLFIPISFFLIRIFYNNFLLILFPSVTVPSKTQCNDATVALQIWWHLSL